MGYKYNFNIFFAILPTNYLGMKKKNYIFAV